MDSAGLAVLVVSDALNSLSYFPWVIVVDGPRFSSCKPPWRL